MTLVEVQTEAKCNEVKTLVNTINKNNVNPAIWTGGLLNKNLKNKFFWISTGNEFTYSNWEDHNPDHHYYEFCVEIRLKNSFKWNDITCWDKQSFICEYSKKELEYQNNLHNLNKKNEQIQVFIKEQKDLKDKLNKEIQNNINLKLQHEEHLNKLQNQTFETEINLKMEKNKTEEMIRKIQQLESTENDLKQELDKKNRQIQEFKKQYDEIYNEKANNNDHFKEIKINQEETSKILNNILNISQNRTKNSDYDIKEKNNDPKTNGVSNTYFITFINNNQ